MADDTTLNAGTGGDVIASDDIGGVKYQRTKVVWGADGAATDASAAAPLPVVQTGTHNIGTVTTVTTVAAVTAISNALPAGTNNIGDVDVLSVVPGTGATALGKAADSAAGATDTGVALLCVRDDALTTLTPADGDYVPARVDSTGSLHVRVSAGSIAGFANDVALTIGTSEGIPVMGRASTATPSAVSADNDAVHAWLTRTGATVISGDNVDDAAFTPGTSRVVVIAGQADEGSTDSVDEGDAGAIRITLDRKQIITPYAHAAAGGHTPHQNLDVDETEDDIKTSPGKLFWIHVMNLHASSTRYIKFYNATAADTTVGSTTPSLTFGVPANVNGFCIHFGDAGVQFDTAICVAATTGFAVADTGAPGANEVILNCGYI